LSFAQPIHPNPTNYEYVVVGRTNVVNFAYLHFYFSFQTHWMNSNTFLTQTIIKIMLYN
jgi:hypothetical protein